MPDADSPLLKDLNDGQRLAVTTEAEPLCILAGAGSGKTRVLTRRIAYRIAASQTADADHVLALTFTRKAAGELRHRLHALGVHGDAQVKAGTFHAVAYAQLRQRWADRGERPPTLLDRKVGFIARLLGPRRATLQPIDVASEIEWAKARMVPPSQYVAEHERAGRTPPMPAAEMAAIYERYEADKKRRGVVDFDDLLKECAEALHREDEFAASQRWRFRHLFVDEFQDVNPVQFQLLKGWLGPRADLCVVGDPNQAIYSWNGADLALIGNFERLFPGGTVVALDDNYRSTPQILATAAAVLRTDQPMRAHRDDGAMPALRSYATEVAEARGIAARLRREHGPTRPWSHMAVLVRTNAQALVFENALRSAQIPSRIKGAGRFLERPEVVDALAQLDRAPARAPLTARLADLEAELAEAAADETNERVQNVEQLVRLVKDYLALDPSAQATGSMASFKAWLQQTTKGDEPDPGGDAVEVVTFHRAKGLEWPIVFVAGMERGLVPIGRAESDEAQAEERRLLYVALTPARDELHCSWAERRTFGETAVARHPSPWLGVIEDAVARLAGDDAGGAPSDNIRRLLDRERTKLRGSGGRGSAGKGKSKSARSPTRVGARMLGDDPDPAVFAALKEWRSRAARAANVPAYVIFHDTTLAAVAEARPTSRDALLGIPGLGPVKAERYGEALLQVVAESGKSA